MPAAEQELNIDEKNKLHLATLMDNRKLLAKEKIYNMVRSYPKDTHDEWVVFGYGGVKISLGDLKDLFGIER
jgi:hypothetical protein